MKQGKQKVVQNQLGQLHWKVGAILYICVGRIKRKGCRFRSRYSGLASRV